MRPCWTTDVAEEQGVDTGMRSDEEAEARTAGWHDLGHLAERVEKDGINS